jgi:hypothetical protein
MAKQLVRHPPRLSERQIAELHQAVNRARRRFALSDSLADREHRVTFASDLDSQSPQSLREGALPPLLIDRRQR